MVKNYPLTETQKDYIVHKIVTDIFSYRFLNIPGNNSVPTPNIVSQIKDNHIKQWMGWGKHITIQRTSQGVTIIINKHFLND